MSTSTSFTIENIILAYMHLTIQCPSGSTACLFDGLRHRPGVVNVPKATRLIRTRGNDTCSSRCTNKKGRSRINAAADGGAINPDGIIGPDGEIIKRAAVSDPEERRDLWKRAIKLPMYSVGLAPVLVSATAAFVDYGAFQPLKTLGLCIAAVAIIAWLNLSNDVFDAATGVDKNKAESVVNLTGNWRHVFIISNMFLILGVGLLFSIISSVVRVSWNEYDMGDMLGHVCQDYEYILIDL